MFPTARAVLCLGLAVFPLATFAQAGPADPQIINAASTTKINVGQRKLAGYLAGTVHVSADGKVVEVTMTENTTDSGFEDQLIKVLRNARFRPAINESGA